MILTGHATISVHWDGESSVARWSTELRRDGESMQLGEGDAYVDRDALDRGFVALPREATPVRARFVQAAWVYTGSDTNASLTISAHTPSEPMREIA